MLISNKNIKITKKKNSFDLIDERRYLRAFYGLKLPYSKGKLLVLLHFIIIIDNNSNQINYENKIKKIFDELNKTNLNFLFISKYTLAVANIN